MQKKNLSYEMGSEIALKSEYAHCFYLNSDTES